MLTSAGEGGAEVYSVATKKEQAKIVWEEARRMVKKSPALFKRIRTLINGLFYDNTESFFKALASDSNSLDGLNSFYVIADEIHAWKDKNLIDVMYDSMSGREEPIFSEFSTMGTVRENVFDNEYEYGSDLIETFEKTGVMKDERILFIIYELDNPKEIEKEECWYKPNPGLGTIKNVNILRDKVKTASNNPNELPNLIKEGIVPTLGDSRYVLFELPLRAKVMYTNEVINKLLSMKLIPIIAHPERYELIQDETNIAIDWVEQGALLQANYASIVGRYGMKAKETLLKLLDANAIHFLGTDNHRSGSVYTRMDEIKKEFRRKIGRDKLYELSEINPRSILNNEEFEIEMPKKIKKGRIF